MAPSSCPSTCHEVISSDAWWCRIHLVGGILLMARAEISLEDAASPPLYWSRYCQPCTCHTSLDRIVEWLDFVPIRHCFLSGVPEAGQLAFLFAIKVCLVLFHEIQRGKCRKRMRCISSDCSLRWSVVLLRGGIGCRPFATLASSPFVKWGN